MPTTRPPITTDMGVVLFAYDGSDLAKRAIEAAAGLLGSGREARVLTVWHPVDVGFLPDAGIAINAADPVIVREAAEQSAAAGALLAADAGFRAAGEAMEATPAWVGIVGAADAYHASVIVLGSHGRTGRARQLLGSVAGAVAEHSHRSVLIVHRDSTSLQGDGAGERRQGEEPRTRDDTESGADGIHLQLSGRSA